MIAVSKTKSTQDIEKVYHEGQRDFGENYADELIQKARSLKHLKDINWVFIGPLQSNKIQRLVEVCSEIQTVSSLKHARYIQRYASELHKTAFPVWIQVNIASEAQKHGVALSELQELQTFIESQCPNLELNGIMVVPPASYSDDAYPDSAPKLYMEIASTAKSVGKGKISLGMTSDLNIAVAAGSHCVRIGTAVFGRRN
jgi:pyridoxal phosphate enzyme (YggS family)